MKKLLLQQKRRSYLMKARDKDLPLIKIDIFDNKFIKLIKDEILHFNENLLQ